MGVPPKQLERLFKTPRSSGLPAPRRRPNCHFGERELRSCILQSARPHPPEPWYQLAPEFKKAGLAAIPPPREVLEVPGKARRAQQPRAISPRRPRSPRSAAGETGPQPGRDSGGGHSLAAAAGPSPPGRAPAPSAQRRPRRPQNPEQGGDAAQAAPGAGPAHPRAPRAARPGPRGPLTRAGGGHRARTPGPGRRRASPPEPADPSRVPQIT